jgi:hypothetical protein
MRRKGAVMTATLDEVGKKKEPPAELQAARELVRRRATQALLERELVAGFAEMAYVGLVTVAATSHAELDQHA